MLQILGVRHFEKNGELIGYDAFHDEKWTAPSVQHLLRDLPTYLKQIPESNRWNLFYTIANCTAAKRDFASQSVLVFDLDHVDYSKIEETIGIVLSVLGVRREDTGIIASGYGLHFIIGLEKKFINKDFFKLNKHHYKAVGAQIKAALTKANLEGDPDTSIFEPRRILRLPGTINRKPNREDKPCYIVSANITPTSFSLAHISGIPDISEKEQLPRNYLKKFPKVDTQAVLEGCEFLKHMKENPQTIDEPQWYAGLSILARLDNGGSLCHEYSKDHPKYSHEETEKKIGQALEASGPRTCSNVNDLWGECAKCPFNQKIKSPIMLRGEGTLETENTGFYNVSINDKGMVKLTPCYNDLIKFFERKNPFVTLGGSRIVYIWNGTHYQPIENATLELFAYEHMDPKPTMQMCEEFRRRVCINNQQPSAWFSETTRGKVNLLNGVLDIETMQLMEHSPDRGYRYCLTFNYNSAAVCPIYDQMMNRIATSNKALQDVLDEFQGFIIVGEKYFPNKALVLIGEGANGKTTWINVTCSLIGHENYSGLTLLDIQDSEYNRQLMDGKLMNISEETSVKSFADSSTFKKLVGGGIIQVRKPYKDPYEIVNKTKLIITCNELPRSYDSTHGFYRRLLLVPFTRKFSKNDADYDPNIEAKIIKDELPGVFNRAISAYKRLKKQMHFTESQIILDKIEEYSLGIDNVKRWCLENVAYFDNGEAEKTFLSIRDMYDHYKSLTEYGGEKPVTAIAFGIKLKTLIKDYGGRYGAKKIEKKIIRGIRGVYIAEGAGLQLAENVDKSQGVTPLN